MRLLVSLNLLLLLGVGSTEGFMPLRSKRAPPKLPKLRLHSTAMHEVAQAPLLSLPTVQIAEAFNLGNGQVIGYFVFLSVLIAVPFVGGTFDTIKISEFREKRQDFIDSIEEEIEGLQEDGSPEALVTAKELKLKLGEVYAEVSLDAMKDEEKKFLGMNRYIMQMQGKPLSDDSPEKRATAAGSAPGSEGGARGLLPGEAVDPDEAKGNREERRMARKLKKRRAPKRIDNRNA